MSHSDEETVQTIQLTAKKWKAKILVGWLLFFAGMIGLFSGEVAEAFLAMFLGLGCVIYAGTMKWWHHG